tara:strand:+ start:890 stop:1114 length:225 start_codon:yes stop_codon:yes gene_type:complete
MAVNFLQQVNISDFLEVEGNMKVDSTGYLQIPVGTTAQRPTPQYGMIRYNSTTEKVESVVPDKFGDPSWAAIGP